MKNKLFCKFMLALLLLFSFPLLDNSNFLFSQGNCKVTFCSCCGDSANYDVYSVNGTYVGNFVTDQQGGCSQLGVLNATTLQSYYVEENNELCDSWTRVYFTACPCVEDSIRVKLPCCNPSDNKDGKNSKDGKYNPNDFKLNQNYPNPFNPVTQIGFNLPVGSYVKITIYDINGRTVDIPLQADVPAGYHELVWNADNLKLSSGIYFYKLEAGDFTNERKMILLK